MNHKTVLSNGLRITTHEMKDRDSITIGFWVGSGGRHETDKLKGAAHFLEHILFKGSKKYSCGEIKEQIEGVGGSLNAFTTEEQTCYYAKIPSKHLSRTFDILADMVFAPAISKTDVDKERGVIIEEIKMYHDLPQYFVLELLDEMTWPNHPLGKSLAGSAETVGKMSNRDLKEFHGDHYAPGNVVIAACGRLSHQALVNLAKRKLKDVKGNPENGFVKADNSQTSPKTKFFVKDIEQMHLALGMPGLEENHKDRYALSLLNVILGGNMSSRLFDEVREKRGLAYSISSCYKSMKDTGLFMVRAGVDNQKIVEAVDVILKELAKVKKNGVKSDEFKRAKEYALGQLLLSMEDTMDRMLWIGSEMISRNKVRTLNEVVKKVKAVTSSDVKRLAKSILNEKQYNLAIVGPVKDEQQRRLSSLLNR